VKNYLWQFAQEGVVLWESSWYGAEAAGSRIEILPGSEAHASFAPGPLEIWVWPIVNEGLGAPTFLSACLQGKAEQAPPPQPSPVPAADPALSPSVLYREDFEDGEAGGWTYDNDPWTIQQAQDGNQYWNVLGPTGHSFAGFDPLNSWTDFAFEARIRFMADGDRAFNVNLRSTSQGTYVMGVNATGIFHIAFDDTHTYTILQEGKYPALKARQWYTVKMQVKGDMLRLYLDNNLMVSVQDSRLQSGTIGISVDGRNPMQIDDIRVTALR
jgi:hypothetical protein